MSGTHPASDPAAALRGDAAAFDALYELYFTRVYAFVQRHTSERATAERLTEEALLRVFRDLGSAGEEPLPARVFRTVRRVVRGEVQRQGPGSEAVGLWRTAV
jgi:DNA-directed RNA polymerase specialized sigma24 family protein